MEKVVRHNTDTADGEGGESTTLTELMEKVVRHNTDTADGEGG